MHITRQHAVPGRRWRALGAGAVVAAALLTGCGETKEASSLTGAAGAPAKDDTTAVREAYLAFEKAGAAQQTEQVVDLLSASTLEYMDEMRELALTASKAELSKQRVIDQITVLGMRADGDPELLRTAEPRELLVKSQVKDQITAPDTGAAEKAVIEVKGDVATAADPADPGTALTFVREGGAWKFDLTALFDDLDTVFAGMVETTGRTKTQVVEQSIAGQAGGAKKVKALWKPLGR